jgi:hypothetical protein
MTIKKLFPLILTCCFSVPVLATDDELKEITLDEKVDTLQEKVENRSKSLPTCRATT